MYITIENTQSTSTDNYIETTQGKMSQILTFFPHSRTSADTPHTHALLKTSFNTTSQQHDIDRFYQKLTNGTHKTSWTPPDSTQQTPLRLGLIEHPNRPFANPHFSTMALAAPFQYRSSLSAHVNEHNTIGLFPPAHKSVSQQDLMSFGPEYTDPYPAFTNPGNTEAYPASTRFEYPESYPAATHEYPESQIHTEFKFKSRDTLQLQSPGIHDETAFKSHSKFNATPSRKEHLLDFKFTPKSIKANPFAYSFPKKIATDLTGLVFGNSDRCSANQKNEIRVLDFNPDLLFDHQYLPESDQCIFKKLDNDVSSFFDTCRHQVVMESHDSVSGQLGGSSNSLLEPNHEVFTEIDNNISNQPDSEINSFFESRDNLFITEIDNNAFGQLDCSANQLINLPLDIFQENVSVPLVITSNSLFSDFSAAPTLKFVQQPSKSTLMDFAKPNKYETEPENKNFDMDVLYIGLNLGAITW